MTEDDSVFSSAMTVSLLYDNLQQQWNLRDVAFPGSPNIELETGCPSILVAWCGAR